MAEKKEQFTVICPKCKGEEVHIYNTIYDEILIECENKECKFIESEYKV